MASESVSLPAEALPELRRVIAFGMSAIGEIQRLQNLAALDKLAGSPWPEDRRAIHPCGYNVIADFASALMWLDCATDEKVA